MMHPVATMTIHAHIFNGAEPVHYVYEGDAIMSQEQKDRLQSLVGNGLAKVSVGRDLSEKDFGNGGGVMVNVTITCDQNEQNVHNAINLASEIVNAHAWYQHQQLKQQLIQTGILK